MGRDWRGLTTTARSPAWCARQSAPFELCDGAQHLQREHALWRSGIDRVAQATEMRAGGLELLDDGEKMADRAGEAIEPDHDQGLAGRISCSRRASTGRLRSAPEACSSSTVTQPAARRSSSCGSVSCSSVETRAYPIRRPVGGIPAVLPASVAGAL